MPATIYRLVNQQGETTYIGSTEQDPPEKRWSVRDLNGRTFDPLLTVPSSRRWDFERETMNSARSEGHPLTNKNEAMPKKSKKCRSLSLNTFTFRVSTELLSAFQDYASDLESNAAVEIRKLMKQAIKDRLQQVDPGTL